MLAACVGLVVQVISAQRREFVEVSTGFALGSSSGWSKSSTGLVGSPLDHGRPPVATVLGGPGAAGGDVLPHEANSLVSAGWSQVGNIRSFEW